jgi:hypothetical protein
VADLWYKNAVIYCLAVETFMDSDSDGVGDSEGVLLLETDSPSVFAHACERRGRGIAAVHNLASEPCTFYRWLRLGVS